MRALQQMGKRGCKVGYIMIADGPGPFLKGLDTLPCALTCRESPCNGSSQQAVVTSMSAQDGGNMCVLFLDFTTFSFHFFSFFITK